MIEILKPLDVLKPAFDAFEACQDFSEGYFKLKRINRHADAELTERLPDRVYVTDRYGALRVESYGPETSIGKRLARQKDLQ